jgi:hypothetical protein
MPTKNATSRDAQTVETFLAHLDHPLAQEVRALRQIILAADPRVREEIKWNAPSFATTEHFATFNLRAKDAIQLVLHRGAKVREMTDQRLAIPDPLGLLAWRSPDRALATFSDMADVVAKRDALSEIVRAWIAFV